MMYFKILCFLCFGCSFGSLKEISSEPAELIIGGQNADIKDFPYMLSLGQEVPCLPSKYWHICGASIINPSWALSAAHCYNDTWFPKENLRIRSGSTFNNKGGMLHHVQEFMVHPKYITNRTDYDVSLIKVSNPFVYGATVKPIDLAKETPPVGTEMVVAGWGISTTAGDMPEQLQAVHLYVWDISECKLAFQLITPRMLCVKGPEAGILTRKGDSGGPLVAHGKQVGIVSHGDDVADVPEVATDVPSVQEWVISVTKHGV